MCYNALAVSSSSGGSRGVRRPWLPTFSPVPHMPPRNNRGRLDTYPRRWRIYCMDESDTNDGARLSGAEKTTRRGSLLLVAGLSSACVVHGNHGAVSAACTLENSPVVLWFGRHGSSSMNSNGFRAGGTMDAEFANVLIRSLSSVAGTTRVEEYTSRCEALREVMLPRFQEAHTCGHCGSVEGRQAFRDAAYFDFETYIRAKAILEMAPEDDRKRDLYIRNATIAIGSSILKHIVEETYTEDAEQMGISPFFSLEASTRKDSLLSASPDLDSIRMGVKSLLNYFVRKGFVRRAGIAQCGVSREDEFENHLSWYRGDTASLKYWLVEPVDGKSSLALQEEEGTYVGYISSTIAAFLRRCGVSTSSVRRIPSLSDSAESSEQCIIRRVKDISLDDGRSWVIKGNKAWKPDTVA